MTRKRLLLFTIIIFMAVLSAFLIYNAYKSEPTIEETAEEAAKRLATEEGEVDRKIVYTGEGTTASRTLFSITTEPIVSPVVTDDKTFIKYFLQENGQLYKSSFDGDKTLQISASPLKNFTKGIWSINKHWMISLFTDSSDTVTKYFYDYKTNSPIKLNQNIKYLSWSPDGNEIAYHYENEYLNENNISISYPDGTNTQSVFETRLQDLIVDWTTNDSITIWQKPSGFVESSVYSIDTTTGEFSKLIDKKYGLNISWSPMKNKLLYSATNKNGKDIGLYLADSEGKNAKNLNIVSLVEKTAWSHDNRTIYYAQPKVISTNETVLPDDFYKGIFHSSDILWRVNTETMDKTMLFFPSDTAIKIDAENLFLSPEEDYLFFINRYDGRLYGINL